MPCCSIFAVLQHRGIVVRIGYLERRICWSRNTAITCRCIARAGFAPGRGSNSTARHCAIGSARPPDCWSAKSTLASAFRYAINRREALSRFLTGGRLECRWRTRGVQIHDRADRDAQWHERRSLSQGRLGKDRRRASDQPDPPTAVKLADAQTGSCLELSRNIGHE